MLISPAYAQAAGGGGGFDIQALLPLVLIFAVFYFLLIRPQQKRAKQHKEMLGAIRRGDKVATGGGIIGTVSKVADDELTVEIAKDVRVQVLRGSVSNVLSRTTPAGGEAKPAAAPTSMGAGLGKLLGFKKDDKGGDKAD
ncbi:MAG: preprotein translocase subunit YajC [Alphaproteobacteria bacterium]